MAATPSSFLQFRRLIPRIGLAVLSLAVAQAQVVWDGGAGTGNWATGNNWDTNTVPVATDDVQFAGTVQTAVALGANRTINTLAFNAGADPFTISGYRLTINGGSVTNNSTNLQTVASAITQGAATSYDAASGNLTFSGALNNGGFAMTTTGAEDTTFAGVISGTGGLTQSGTGLVTLSGANTFLGGVTLSDGTLRATTSAAALGSGALTLAGGDLQLANNAALNFGRATTISADTLITSDRLTSGAGVSHTLGTLSIGANTLTLAAGANVGSGTAGLTFGATTLSASGATFTANIGTMLVIGAISGTYNFTVGGDGNTTLNGIVGTSTGSITKTGGGTVTLNKANTFSGGLTIKAGTASGTTSASAFGTGTITLGDTSGSANATLSGGYAGPFTNAITVAAGSTGDAIITNTATTTFSGAVTLNKDLVLAPAGNRALTLSGGITGTGNLIIAGTGTTASTTLSTNTVNHSGTITNQGTNTGATTISAVIGSNVTGITQNSASSRLTLAGNNSTLAAWLRIYAGTLSGTTSANAFGTGTITIGDTSGSANATLSGGFAGPFTNPITVAAGSTGTATITNSANTTFSGAVTLNKDLVLAPAGNRALTLSGGITGSGDLIIAGTGTTASTTLSTNTINHIGTITNQGTNTGATTISAVIGANVTGITQNSATSQLTLSGLNTFDAPVTIAAGTLSANTIGNVGGGASALGAPTTVANGTIALGSGTSTGTLNYTGATTSSDRVFNLAGTTGGATINASSAGAAKLTLTSNLTATGIGAKTFTLGGINTALNTFAGLIVDGSGTTSFTKAGTGTWLLTGANTYTGATTISGGNLFLSGSGAISADNLAITGGVFNTSGTITRALGTGAGQLVWTSGGFAAYGGALTINGITGTPVWGSTPSFLTGTMTLGSTRADNVVTLTNDFSLGTANRTLNTLDNTGSTADYAVLSGVISSGAGGGLTKAGTGRLDLTGANTYSGPTKLLGGTTVINTLGDVSGGASSLGAPTTVADGTIDLGSTTTTATLFYTGTGSSTNRVLNLAGTTGGAIIQNNGTGALVFTAGSLTATGNGVKTLTLTGTDTNTSEIQGTIVNSLGNTAVTKAGTGTWQLSGANTYSGATTLAGGILIAGHNSAFGTGTFIFNGGNLRGDGVAHTFSNNVTLAGSSSISGTSDLTFTGNLNLSGANRIFTISNTGLTTFSGVVSGATGFRKYGAGSLVLANANTYTGTTTLTAGTLVAGSNTALGTGAIAFAGGALQGDGVARTLGNTLTMSASSTLSGTSDLTLTGTLTNSANTTFNITNTAATTLANINLSNSATNRTLTLNTTGGDVTIGGVIANGGTSTASRLAKTGAGTLVLSGANTYGGTTTIYNGTLRSGANDVLPNTNVTLAATGAGATATLDLNNYSDTIGALSFSGTTTTSTANVTTGTGTLTLGGNVSYSSTNNPQGATIAGNLSLGAASRTFTVNNSTTAADDLTVSATISGAAGTGLTKAGNGTFKLSGANTYDGTTTISAGTLHAAHNNALGTTASGTTVANLAALNLSNNITIGAEALTLSGNGSGGGALLNVSGDNAYGGAITLAANTRIGSTAGTLTLNGASLNLNSFTLTLDGAGDINLALALAGTASFTKTGTGTLQLGAAQNTTGTITLAGGTLQLGGLSHTIGTLQVTGNSVLDFSGVSTLNLTTLNINAGVMLTITNWVDAVDYFYVTNNPGATILNRITFSGYTSADTKWITYDTQVTPVPEPSTYGALLLGLVLSLCGWRRWRGSSGEKSE